MKLNIANPTTGCQKKVEIDDGTKVRQFYNKRLAQQVSGVVDKDEALLKDNDPGCTVCEMAVVWAQNQLRQNKTKEQIDAYLNQLCERLPSPNGKSTVDCKTLSSMPSISFTIAGKSFELAPEELSIY